MPDAAIQMSPLDAMVSSELPGLGEYALPVPCESEELERLPVHTAERFRAAEPKLYAIACALFFGERLSVLPICKALRISQHTLLNIVSREMRGATAEAWRQDLVSRLRVGGTLAVSALTNLLVDEAAVGCAGIKGVAMATRELAHAHELLTGRPTDRRETTQAPSDDAAVRGYLDRLARPATIDCAEEKGEVSREVEEIGEADGREPEEV